MAETLLSTCHSHEFFSPEPCCSRRCYLAWQHVEQGLVMWQVLKHYMKIDTSDYGEGTPLVRTTSRKRPLRTDSMQEGAVQGNTGVTSANGLESRATDAGTPFLPEDASPGVNGILSSRYLLLELLLATDYCI